jgi:proteasome lid subunit RPN8/RPN11
MFTAALYEWSVAACPVNIFLDIPLADRLRAAAMASDVEIGGFLVGRFEDNRTIVTDFELVESEHRRGTAYSLSRRDDQALLAKLAASRKRRREVVGFFRSHLRPGMFLDAADFHTISSHFNHPQQVTLLISPSEDGLATGGFFFWQDGEMDRKETYRVFPMHSEELEAGKPAQTQLAFEAAETMDSVPRVPVPDPQPGPTAAAIADRKTGTPDHKNSWTQSATKIGLVAAAAALGGYYLGTSGSREHFGSRPGDITIGDAAPAPVASAPPAPTVAARKVVPPESQAEPPKPAALVSRPVPPRSVPEPKKAPSPVRPNQHAVFDEMVRNGPPASATPAPPPEPVSQPPASPAPPVNTGAFPHNPNPLPAPSPPVQTAEATIDLEAAQDSGIKHVLHKIPLFGGHGNQDFQPAQVIRRTAPHVPPEVARELTGNVPVTLKLKVDITGRVSAVELVSRGSDRTLVQLAGDAAYGWQFQPATVKDRPVSSEVIAHFVFKPSL